MPNPRHGFKLGTANAETAPNRHSTSHFPTGTRCGREVPFVSNAGEEMGLTEVKWHGQGGTRYETRQSSPRVSAKPWFCSYTRGHLQNGGNKAPPKLVSVYRRITQSMTRTSLHPETSAHGDVFPPTPLPYGGAMMRYRKTRSHTQTTLERITLAQNATTIQVVRFV